MDITQPLTGRTVLVTGASRGIGKAIVQKVYSLGANVSLMARDLETLRLSITDFLPTRTHIFAGDVANANEMERFLAESVSKFGKIDCVIANAGIGSFGSVLDIDASLTQEIVNTNILGTIFLVQKAVPHMTTSENKDIIIIASTAGFRGGRNEAVYAATKHAQVGFAGALDRELLAKGFRVALVSPASTNTEFAFGRGRGEDQDLEGFLSPDDVAQQVSHIILQPRNLRIQNIVVWPNTQQS